MVISEDVFEHGTPIDPVDGKILETPALRAEGLRRFRAALREWVGSHEAEVRASLDKGKVPTPAPEDDLMTLFFPRLDDRFLAAFLRCRKYRIADSVKVVTNYSRLWTEHPEWREGLNAEDMAGAYERSQVRFTPGADRQGNTVALQMPGRLDWTTLQLSDLFRLSFYSTLWLIDCAPDDYQLRGICEVVNYDGFTVGKVYQMMTALPSEAQKQLQSIYHDVFPIRIRRFLLFNTPWFFSMIWTFVRFLIPSKLRERTIHIGSDHGRLFEYVDPSVLPMSFGGTHSDEDEWLGVCADCEKAGWSPFTGIPEDRIVAVSAVLSSFVRR